MALHTIDANVIIEEWMGQNSVHIFLKNQKQYEMVKKYFGGKERISKSEHGSFGVCRIKNLAKAYAYSPRKKLGKVM
jgi:hypothetical protein